MLRCARVVGVTHFVKRHAYYMQLATFAAKLPCHRGHLGLQDGLAVQGATVPAASSAASLSPSSIASPSLAQPLLAWA